MKRYHSWEKNQIAWKLKRSKSLLFLERECLSLSKELAESVGHWKDPRTHKETLLRLRSKWEIGDFSARELKRQAVHRRAYQWLTKNPGLEIAKMGEVHRRIMGAEKILSFRRRDAVAKNLYGETLHEFPAPGELGELLGDLHLWCETAAELGASRALVLHSLITSIHPYRDGNGRLARAYEQSWLQDEGFVFHPGWNPQLMVYWDAAGHREALVECQKKQWVTPFVEFMWLQYRGIAQGLLIS